LPAEDLLPSEDIADQADLASNELDLSGDIDAAETVILPRAVFVEAGAPIDILYEGSPWASQDKWLTASGCSRFVHAGRRIGTGDFRVSLRMKISSPEGAVFLFQGSNHLLFRDVVGNMKLEGPLFPNDSLPLGPSGIKDDVPFTLELVRVGNSLDLRLDDVSLYTATIDSGEFGTVGVAPGLAVWLFGMCASEAMVSVSDFWVDGTTRPLAPPPAALAVFQRGANGYSVFRIPALAREASTGTLLAFAEGRVDGEGDSGNIDLVLQRSLDGGITWGPLQVVVDDADNTCGNPVPIVDNETGKIWLVYTTADGDLSESEINAGKGTRDAWVTSSSDSGLTWAIPTLISSFVKGANWRWLATGPGHGIQLSDGRLVAPCNYTVGPQSGDAVSCSIVSDDHGVTWSAGGSVPGGFGDESSIAERSDGTLLMSFRSRYSVNRRGFSHSSDRGSTWTPGQEEDAFIDPHCQGSLLRTTNPSWEAATGSSGVLLLSNIGSTQREFLTVRASLDGGSTWPVAQWLYPGPAAYSDMTEFSDGTIGVLYERGELSPYDSIVFSVLNPVWLLEPVFGASGG
jgi:sialidase-1